MSDDDKLSLVEADARRWLLDGNSCMAKYGVKMPRLHQLVLWNCPMVGPYNLRAHRTRARRPWA